MRWAAFMRGLNVGGHRVTNDELVEVFSSVGLTNAQPYQASGNMVFDGTGSKSSVVETKLAQAFESAFGYAVPTMVRPLPRVAELAAAAPFSQAQIAASEGKLQVIFLKAKLTAKTLKVAKTLLPDNEHFSFDETEIFWLPAAGIKDSVFNLPKMEKAVGPMTVRTHGTVSRLAKKFAD